MLRTWELIIEGPGKMLAHVKVGAGPFQVRPKTVVRLRGVGNIVLAITGIINGMRPGVIHRGTEPAPVAEAHRGLQRVVSAASRRLELIDINETRKPGGSSRRVGLVDVHIAEELAHGGAYIAHLQRHVPAELLL